MIRIFLVGFLLVVYLGQPATAAVNVTYCVELDHDYSDGSVGDYLTGDAMKARGIQIRFIPVNNPAAYIDKIADWNGTNAGCWNGNIVNDTYTVNAVSRAEVNGHTIRIEDDNSGLMFGWTIKSNHVPLSNTTYTAAGNSVGPHEWVNMMAVAAWGLTHRPAGLSGEFFTFVVDLDNSASNGNSWLAGSDEIWVINNDFKFTVAHEMGHKIAYERNGGANASFSYKAGMGDCNSSLYDLNSHYMSSKEFQSAAASEGIANFYAAAILNNNSEDDCEHEKPYTIDWDHDGTGDVQVFSCNAGFGLPQIVGPNDYYAEHCLGTGPDDNRGTELDWLRMFWDIHRVNGANRLVSKIFQIWDEADPDQWNATGKDTGSGYPAHEMSKAADDIDILLGDDYDVWAATHGTDR